MSTTPTQNSPRGIDHVVIATRDLDRLAAQYKALGFTVGPRNRHPWGTENHIVQFPGCFIELIGVAAGAEVPEHEARNRSFGASVRDFIKSHEGAALLALESRNAIGDAEQFRRLNIGDFEPFHFERHGKDADGKPRTVSFTLAFAAAPNAPQTGFFVCQQHQPQNFWNPSLQQHANGARTIASVVFVTADPSDYHEFFGNFVNQREMRATSFGLELETGRGQIEVLSPDAFRFRFKQPPPLDPGLGLSIGAVVLAASEPRILPAGEAGGIVLAFGAG